MRKQFQNIQNKLIKIAYYVIGLVLFTAILGLVFGINNETLNLIIKFTSFIYLECLLVTLIVLKYFDLKDDAKEKRYVEFIPWVRTDMFWLITYVGFVLASLIIIDK